jgi:hypothetical protein
MVLDQEKMPGKYEIFGMLKKAAISFVSAKRKVYFSNVVSAPCLDSG